jgi:hypothetical protein
MILYLWEQNTYRVPLEYSTGWPTSAATDGSVAVMVGRAECSDMK